MEVHKIFFTFIFSLEKYGIKQYFSAFLPLYYRKS